MTAEMTTIIKEIAAKTGTPFYLFDEKTLKDRVRYLKEAFPGVELVYAMKANPFIVGTLRDLADRFEVCSPGEYDICVAQRIPAEKLVISGVYKSGFDTERMMRDNPGIGCYTVESMTQFRQLRETAEKYNRRVSLLLRLTAASQFGMMEDEIAQIITERETYPLLDIRGIQIFSGTQKTSSRRMVKEIARVEALLDRLEKESGYVGSEVEFGAGLAVDYFQKEGVTPEAEAEKERVLFAELAAELKRLGERVHVTMELGRSIAASCGTFVTAVVDKKTNDRENYAILDGGLHHMTYYGQMMAMKVPYYERIPAAEVPENASKELWNLCGSLCSVNDLIVKQLPVAGIAIGDLFAFARTGAYCSTEGISLFLSRALPAVVLLGEDKKARLARPHIDTYPMNMVQSDLE